MRRRPNITTKERNKAVSILARGAAIKEIANYF
jgi:hypothetical protein